jgi:hypothetical protein
MRQNFPDVADLITIFLLFKFVSQGFQGFHYKITKNPIFYVVRFLPIYIAPAVITLHWTINVTVNVKVKGTP